MFRFSIRDLLLVTPVAGLGLSWYLDRSRLLKWGIDFKRNEELLKWQVTNLKEYIESKERVVTLREDCMTVEYNQGDGNLSKVRWTYP